MAVLILLDRAVDLLPKSIILHKGGHIRESYDQIDNCQRVNHNIFYLCVFCNLKIPTFANKNPQLKVGNF